MSDTNDVDPERSVSGEYDIDAPPEKVWRAMTVPAIRERWLPGVVLSNPEPTETSVGRKVRYRMRDKDDSFGDSVVTFEVRPNGGGGATLRILHELRESRIVAPTPGPANRNRPPQMRAA